VAGPYGAIVANGTDVATDRWVWAVTFASNLTPGTSTYQVVVDYVTGEFLELMTQAPERAHAAGPDSPVVIGGQPVHGGDDARLAIGTSANTPVLVGGWLLGTDRRLCPADGSAVPLEAAWNPCAGAWLHAAPTGGNPIALVNLAGVTIPSVPEDEAVPVILRVHTHDPSCIGDDCLLPVIESVAWTGAPTKIDLMGAPPDGISAAQADRAAADKRLVPAKRNLTTVRVTAATTLAGLEATTGTGVSGPGTTPASWVWVVVLTDGSTPARSAAFVVVNMKTGQAMVAGSSYP
jgi:hypothetical protein